MSKRDSLSDAIISSIFRRDLDGNTLQRAFWHETEIVVINIKTSLWDFSDFLFGTFLLLKISTTTKISNATDETVCDTA